MKIRSALSKDEVASLSDDQKEAHAQRVWNEARMRADLESRARYGGGGKFIPALTCIVAVGMVILIPGFYLFAVLGLIAAVATMQWQTHCANERLDAILALMSDLERRTSELEQDHESPAE